MELKNYQKNVLNDLASFLSEYSATGNAAKSFSLYWEGRQYNPGHSYKDALKGVPNVCIKVPTGGGKTFIACNALKIIADAFPSAQGRPVVWFVPSLSILDQTLKAFRDPGHPYRQKMNALFSGGVAIFEKSEALTGAGFDPDTIRRQLSILVVGYDSFRSQTKEGRKVFQENGSLTAFPARFGTGTHITDADETSLAQALNAMRPIVIVDESHNAKSVLSIDMIANLNPAFVLELTATPREESNIISYVDPERLKREQMVKLPVIVYNTRDVNEVVRTAIDLRRKLEIAANEEHKSGAPYIRPIALFQAEPKNAASREEEVATFGKLKEKLVGFGISEKEIAIKTADINELRNVDLLSEKCTIRYIITINALKEGWDCPFAYVLASLANRSSAVDVEQIVGRILRQPYVARSNEQFLNLSYVLTGSDRFMDTLQNVVKGLNRCGFSERDYRVKSEQIANQAGTLRGSVPEKQTDFIEEIVPPKQGTPAFESTASASKALDEIEKIAVASASATESATEEVESTEVALSEQDLADVRRMKIEFVDKVKDLLLPMFFIHEDAGLFNDEESAVKKLSRMDLVKGFSLTAQDISLDFRPTQMELYEVDVKADVRGFSRPEYTRLTEEKSLQFTRLISGMSETDRRRELFAVLYGVLKRFDEIPDKDIRVYIGRVIDAQDDARIADMMQNPYSYADLLKLKVISLMMAHSIKTFQNRATTNSLLVKPSWKFPRAIHAQKTTPGIPKSLYEQEAEVNAFELQIADDVANLDNVLFWHRNIERKGFCLNGFINHYPDFIAVTKKLNVIVIESKGDDRDNTDSERKLQLGQAWEKKSGDRFKYFMVFQTLHVSGAFNRNQFTGMIARL